MQLFSKAFLRDAGERAIKSAVQGFAVGGGIFKAGAVVAQVNIVGFPWVAALTTAGGMALASLVTSVLSTGRDDTISPASAAKVISGRHAAKDGA